MMIQVTQDTLINGKWTGVGVGSFDRETAQHLIRIGVAYEVKIPDPNELEHGAPVPIVITEDRKKKTSSLSQPGQALPEQTAKKPRGRPPKSS